MEENKNYLPFYEGKKDKISTYDKVSFEYGFNKGMEFSQSRIRILEMRDKELEEALKNISFLEISSAVHPSFHGKRAIEIAKNALKSKENE